MDDLDPPREQAGAAHSILKSLECHGLYWDEEVTWQSDRGPAYEDALASLARKQLSFHCQCGRRQLETTGSCGANCRAQQNNVATPHSTRIVVVPDTIIEFDDQLQGRQSIALDTQLKDFVVKRKDGLYAYQLAVAVDDACSGITHILRGADLLDSTARQIYLQQALGLPTPHYCHIPVITNSEGQKFSKQSCADPVTNSDAPLNLRRALAFLQQPTPPTELTNTTSIVTFARAHWSIERVPGLRAIESSPLEGFD
jgi:glutamyl-Q tRNA(Asp) synthetase